MIQKIKRYLSRKVTLTLALIAPFFASAQNNYPEPAKAITIIVPFTAGGSTDKIARIISEPLAQELGTTIRVLNVGGLGGSIGITQLKDAVADGYTLGISALSSFAAYPALHAINTKYHPLHDFTYIINIAHTPHVLAINPNLKAPNFANFIDLAKKSTVPLSYASSGAGSMPNLLMEYLQQLTTIKLQHIPFQGASSALKATILGRTTIMLDQAPSLMNAIKEQKVIPIAVGNPQRLTQLPYVPTFSELGYPTLNRTAFYGLVAPKNLDPKITAKLNSSLHKVLTEPKVKQQINALGAQIIADTPEQFIQEMTDEVNAYKNIVIDNNLAPNK